MAWLHLGNDPRLERFDEGPALDWRFQLRGPLPSPNDIAIVVIDDRSLAKLGRWPLPRGTLAQIVDHLRAAGAKSIGVDILLSEHEPDVSGDGDRRLAAAMEAHGRVVLAAAMLFNDGSPAGAPPSDASAIALGGVKNRQLDTGRLVKADAILQPLAMFESVAGVGHANQQSLEIGQTRAQYPAIGYREWLVPSLPLLLAAAQSDIPGNAVGFDFAGQLIFGARKIPLDDRFGLGLNYLGQSGTIRTYSALDLLEDRIPSGLLNGRAVLVGVSATSLGDNFVTPFALDLPGVEVIATATANFLHGDYLIRTPEQRMLEAVAILIVGLVSWILGFRLPWPRWGLLASLALLVGWLALGQAYFIFGHRLIAIAGPLLAIILGAGLGLLARMMVERRLRSEAELHRTNLARYVPPTLVDALAERATPSFDEREQMAAVMFIDLQGFTHASEDRSPARTAQFLKEFHNQIEVVVATHHGIVTQFLGDGALILWGLPQPRSEDPVSALACARDLLLTLRRWRPESRARIGLHFGPVAMARLGGQNQAQLAAAGDTVNVASRLEAAAKTIGAILVASEELVAAVREAGCDDLLVGFVPAHDQPVRGRDRTISYWSMPDYADLLNDG